MSDTPTGLRAADLKVGDRIRGPADRLFHVRGFVDEYIVVKEWRPSKQRWNYSLIWNHPADIGHYEKVT